MRQENVLFCHWFPFDRVLDIVTSALSSGPAANNASSTTPKIWREQDTSPNKDASPNGADIRPGSLLRLNSRPFGWDANEEDLVSGSNPQTFQGHHNLPARSDNSEDHTIINGGGVPGNSLRFGGARRVRFSCFRVEQSPSVPIRLSDSLLSCPFLKPVGIRDTFC